jgi:gliding motility-associated-like protein
MNNGLGAVVGSKTRLLQPTTEKVTAIPHCNGQDFWVVGSEGGSNRFFTWRLDQDSLYENTPVISSSGQGNSGVGSTKAGYLKPSHDGRQLCEISGIVMNLHQFDPATGVVFDGYEVINRSDQMVVYGCEFSPNNSKLYLTGYRVWQLDLWAGDAQDIRNSLYQVLTDPQSNVGAPTLAPDNIIYITKFSSRNTTLFTIEDPDQSGQGCQFQEFGFDLQNGTGLGAPNFPAGFLFPKRLYTRYPDTTICMDSIAPVWVTGPCDHHNTSWQLLDGGQIDIIHEDSVRVRFDAPGTYRLAVQAESRCGMRYDTIEFKVKNCNCSIFAGSFASTADTFNICDSDTVMIPFNNDHVVSSEDTLLFILHDRPDDTLGNIATTFNRSMAFYRTGLNYNQVYFFSAVAGKKSGQGIDMDDPCLTVSPGVPVVFREIPELAFIDLPGQKCQDSCVWVNAVFSGLPPFTFLVRKAHQRMGQPIPAEYKTTPVNQMSFLWCQDTLDLGLISDKYCSDNQKVTTLWVRSVELPLFDSLSYESVVCQGDSTTISFASSADSAVLINTDNTHNRTLTTPNLTLGPFFADSCFTLRAYNTLGCSIDTNFCIRLIDQGTASDTILKCPSDTLLLPDGQIAIDPAEYQVTLQSTLGCDSLIRYQVMDYEATAYQVETEKACGAQANGTARILHPSGSSLFSVQWPDGDTSRWRTDLREGRYQVEVQDENGCISTVDIIIQEERGAAFSITTKDESCLGDNDGWIELFSDSASFIYNGEVYSSADTLFNLGRGTYDIEVISASGKCTLDTVATVEAGEIITIDLVEAILLSRPSVELPLSVTQGQARSYKWMPTDHLSCTDCPRPLASPTEEMTYRVTVVSENGCEATAQIKVLITRDVFIPTSFTPNGDNINDVFRPYFSTPDQPYRMRIYSRWGELIYQCEGLDCGWDGTMDGRRLMPSVFVYKIEYTSGRSTSEEVRGSITIL